MDLFGPLKTSQSGKKYIIVVTDAFTKYMELIAIPDKQAETVATALFTRWLCRHGLPAEIMSDGGKEFSNEIVNKMLKMMNIEKTTIILKQMHKLKCAIKQWLKLTFGHEARTVNF